MQDDTDVESIARANSFLQPYIIVKEEEAYLVTDRQVICKIELNHHIPLVLMAAFYIFNICYPIGCKNLYSLLEVLVLGNSMTKTTPCVKHMYSSIMN